MKFTANDILGFRIHTSTPPHGIPFIYNDIVRFAGAHDANATAYDCMIQIDNVRQ